MGIKKYCQVSLLILSTMVGAVLSNATQASDMVSSEKLMELVNINTADLSTLSSLKGIGQQKALAIIAYREQQGGFNSLADLLKVKGIGDKVFNGIKQKVKL